MSTARSRGQARGTAARRAAADPARRSRRPSGSGGGSVRGRSRATRGGSDLPARIAVAIPAAVLAVVCVAVGDLAWLLLLTIVGGACLVELYRLLARWRPASVVGLAALVAMLLAARYGSAHVVFEIAVAALPASFLVIVLRGAQRATSVSVAGTLLGVWWIGLAFAHAELLRRMPHGGGVVIDLLVATFLADTAAYLGGRLFGRRPLAPHISPHKTVEGLACGMLMAIVSVVVADLYQRSWLTQTDALILGLVVAVLGPLGDLLESAVKRDAGAKDSGVLFGAHGGALDRLDAVVLTMVGGYYVWLAALH